MRRLRFIAVILMLLLGLSGIVIGLLGEDLSDRLSPLAVIMISTFGAAIFGASLTMIIEEMLGTEVRDIWNYLIAREKFESAPDYLDAVIGVWHVYYQTKADGERLWKYVSYSFTKGDSGKTIGGHFTVADQGGKQRTYIIEAGIRGDSLIAIFKAASGRETDGVLVVPRITATHFKAHIGMEMLETWDGEHALSLSIFSREKLTPDDFGTVADAAKLDQTLQTLMRSQNLVDLKLPA